MNSTEAIRIRSSLARPRQPLTVAERVLILRTSAGTFCLFAILAAILAAMPMADLQKAALVFAGIAFVSGTAFAVITPKYMKIERERIRIEAEKTAAKTWEEREVDELVDALLEVLNDQHRSSEAA